MQEQEQEQKHKDIGCIARFAATGVFLTACALLRPAFSRWSHALFPAYRNVSKALMGLLAAVMSAAPFAVWDIASVCLVLAALVSLVVLVRQRRALWWWLSWVGLAGSLTLFLFVCGWALNHYAPALADEMGLEVGAYSTDELAEATERYLLRAAELAPQVPREEDGTLAEQDFYELARIAGASYAKLSPRYEVFSGCTLPVKALLLAGDPLLYSGHTGIFWAPTGEASVPVHGAPADLPYIMCHEAAHRLGIASEREANFAAYVACEASDDVRLAYSGSYNAFIYCFNALYRVDADRAVALLNDAAEGAEGYGVVLVWNDRTATRAHYDRYEGSFQKVGTTVNDTYLKTFGQDDGVRSYGLVVDYLIAWQQGGSGGRS